MKVFVTGGTGQIGSKLVRRLRERGDAVVLLSRRPAAARAVAPGCEVLEGDPTKEGAWMDAAAGCDAVVNLAGENLFARRWNDDFKRVIRDSRVLSTQNVVKALATNPNRPFGAARALVNASAVGYYGPHGDETLDESAPAGSDFLARTCAEWEEAARAAEAANVRVALIRTGVVLDKEAGALAKLLFPFKMGMGGPVGSGRQWMPWIHHADEVGIFLLALDNGEARGPINATAPNPVTNRDFAKALGRALGRPAFMPTPGFGLKVMLGEVAGVVLDGQQVLPRRAEQLGFTFRFPTIDSALADVLK